MSESHSDIPSTTVQTALSPTDGKNALLARSVERALSAANVFWRIVFFDNAVRRYLRTHVPTSDPHSDQEQQ